MVTTSACPLLTGVNVERHAVEGLEIDAEGLANGYS